MEFVLEDRAAAIPISRLPPPENVWQRFQYTFWHLYAYVHSPARDFLLRIKLIKHKGRQDYLFGKIADGKTFSEFLAHLGGYGFGNHFIAWEDDDEAISLRRLDGAHFQYHLRIFKDGEVRGHYEYAPETHFIRHLKKRIWEKRQFNFADFLDGWIVPAEKAAKK